MKTILSFLVCTFCFISFGQEKYKVNGFEISDIPADYIEIVGTSKILKPFKVVIYVDYGQIGRIKDISKGRVFDESGEVASFNGMMGVVNTFSTNGWELDSTILLSTPNGGSVYHYFFKKK